MDIRPDSATVNGVLHRIIKAVGYPRKVDDGWLESFLASKEPYDVSLHIHPASINTILVGLHNQIVKQTSDLYASKKEGTPNPALQIKRKDTINVYEMLYKGQEKLFQVSLYVDNQAENPEDLNLLTEKCRANMNGLLIIPKNLDFRMADGLKSILPLAEDAIGVRKEFLTSSLSATFPFLFPVGYTKKGVFLGHERNTHNPLFIDFGSMSNKHFFVLGISGSGKSYASKFLIMQHLLASRCKVFILDPNGEYAGLTEKMDGKVIELSKNSKTIINLFDLAGEDFGSKMLTLISVFDIITGGLSESQKGVLNEALIRVYKDCGIRSEDPATWTRVPPKFSNLKKILETMREELGEQNQFNEERSLEVLINRVKMYSKNGFFGFLDKQTKIDLSKGFIDFDLSKLPSQVRQLVMFSVLELISRQIRKDKEPKVVLIDEGWSLLRSKEAENYILEFIKTSRKYNASIGFITQEIEDLLRSEGGKSILNTTSTKILLRQNSSNLDLISKTLALNEKEQNYLLRAEKGNGLLITENGKFEFGVNAPPEVHKLITTDPNESKETAETPKLYAESPIPEFSLSKGFYRLDEVSKKQALELRNNGYELHNSIFLGSKGSQNFLVKTQGNESAEHALLCWAITDELKKRGVRADLAATVEADVTATINGKKVCFEVETGEYLLSFGREKLAQKLALRASQCDKLVVVLTQRDLKWKYPKLPEAELVTRTELIESIDLLFSVGQL